jgi:translation elongation factor EF-4
MGLSEGALSGLSVGRGGTAISKCRYRENDLVLLDIKINGEMVEPLAAIIHRDNAYYVSPHCTAGLRLGSPAFAILITAPVSWVG